MKYFVELTNGYGFTLGRLFPIVDGHIMGKTGPLIRYHPNVQDETGYVVEL